MRLRLSSAAFGLIAVAALSGCHHCCHRPYSSAYPVAECEPRPAPALLPPHPLTPEGSAPAAGLVPPAPAPSAPVPAPPPQPGAPEFRGYGSAEAPARAPGATIQPPAPSNPPADTPRLSPPQTPEPPRAGSAEPRRELPPGPAAGERAATPPLPVGIPQFAVAQDQVTSGLRPKLEGLEWLKSKGYRAVLHLRSPDQADSADRPVVERAGLRYLSLEVSPETLSRQTVQEFNRLVADPANRPLFVYDREGILAGALWYLHFRDVDQDSDEVARLRANRLGLREDGDQAHRAMWLAIQKLLSQQPR